MEKIFHIDCYNQDCKVKFPIKVTLKAPTRSGVAEPETLTKKCPNCGQDNQVTLPGTEQLGNTNYTLRGTNPDE